MAVEARHLHLFPPQLLGNREIMNPIELNTNIYDTHVGFGLPLSGTSTTATNETLLPMYSSAVTDAFPQKTPIKSESGLTYNILDPASRKRSRDSINVYPLLSYQTPQSNTTMSPFSFLGHDLSLHIQQQQFDVDLLISQHMEKLKMEIEEKRKRQDRRIMEAIEEGTLMKKLKAKDEEIENIGKLNWALEEKVKSLFIENQIWRDLAQTNEATVNTLRTNLEQALLASQVKDERTPHGAGLEEDEAQSSCGGGECGWRTVTDGEQDKEMMTREGRSDHRMCRYCGEVEASVLVLPCMHLCLCGACGSSGLHRNCPVCNATKNGSLHVNLS